MSISGLIAPQSHLMGRNETFPLRVPSCWFAVYKQEKDLTPCGLIARNITRTASLAEATQAFVLYYNASGVQPSEKV